MSAGRSPLRVAFDSAEKAVARRVEPVVQTPLFSTTLSAAKAVDAAARRQAERRTRRVLHFLNLPTATDIRLLHQHLAAVEDRVCDIVGEQARSAESRRAGGLAVPDIAELVGTLQGDVARSALRLRNGIKYVAGIDRERVSPTPRRLVWQSGKARLWRYRPDDATTGDPLVIVYSLVSRSYLLDLNAKQSFVATIADAGVPVYLLDWGIPNQVDAQVGLHVYVEEKLPTAVQQALADAGAERATVLGYCLGGVLTLLALAARATLPVGAMIAMATPVDFTQMGLFTQLFAGEGRMDPEDLIDRTGNVPGEAARDAFRMMKPTSTAAAYANLLDNLWNDEFLKSYQTMNEWTKEHVPFPGRVFREIVPMLFRDNALLEGTAMLRGRPVWLEDITVPTLVLAAAKDHIVPLAAAEPLAGLLGGDDVETTIIPAGHVGLVTGGAAVRQTLPRIVEWLGQHGSGRGLEDAACSPSAA